MRRIAIIFLTLIMCSSAQAATLKTPSEVRIYISKFMDSVVYGDATEGFQHIHQIFGISTDELNSVLKRHLAQRNVRTLRVGKSVGYEYLDTKDVGKALSRIRYVERLERAALIWSFYLYKSPEGWILLTMDWSDDLIRVYNLN